VIFLGKAVGKSIRKGSINRSILSILSEDYPEPKKAEGLPKFARALLS